MKCIAALSLAFLACQSAPSPDPATQKKDTVAPAPAITKLPPDTTSLTGSWYLIPVLPADTAAGKTPILVLDPGKSLFSGNTGCNSMHGKFYASSTDSSLSFSDRFAITRMICTGYNEEAFLKSLKNATHYQLRNGTLTLLADDRTALSRWARKPANPPKALKA